MILKKHEKWWETNIGGDTYKHEGKTHRSPSLDDFLVWMGTPFDRDRINVRKLFNKEAKSILDVACGTAAEYVGLQEFRPELVYTGLDITPKLVAHCKDKGINVVSGSANDIPFDDSSFDIVHSRHSLEHMEDFKKPISEMIRVAKTNVYISFFIKPSNKEENVIDLNVEEDCYYNCYSKPRIEEFLNSISKIKEYKWVGLGGHSRGLLWIDLA